jgi:hypothetical protein
MMTEYLDMRLNQPQYRSRGGSSCLDYVAARDLIQDGGKLMVYAGKKGNAIKADGVVRACR